MRNQWLSNISGVVRIRVTGRYVEQVLNRCINEGITIWNVKRVNNDAIIASLHLEDVKRLRPLLRQSQCKIVFTHRRGWPFLLKSMGSRFGFVAGIAIFFVLILLLSNVVWNIEVKGASPKVENELRQVIQELGVKRGVFQFTLPNVEYIQREVSERVEDATWIGVRQKGTTYEFEVVEQQLPEEAERYSPRHLVATKEAIINKVFVEHGQSVVKINDFVREGDLLVSGYIGKEGEEEQKIVAAQAVILGEIWYKSEVEVPLEALFTTLSGERKVKHHLEIGGISLPIWGFGKHSFEQVEQDNHVKPIRFFQWTLPISYERVTYYESVDYERTYTKDEAIAAAKKRAKAELIQHLPNDAEVIGEKVLHEALENGKVKLQIHYQVIEDITSEQPIIQGD
ncbi:sporulation protein YqfD [Halalkalibacter sp. AB-rgal2]|uniref:sporulation protein YqfD n=1 Tax=Halalkalibacter sp. AB-rgal2 TaxID=3242695 RepID=UPI00359EB968